MRSHVAAFMAILVVGLIAMKVVLEVGRRKLIRLYDAHRSAMPASRAPLWENPWDIFGISGDEHPDIADAKKRIQQETYRQAFMVGGFVMLGAAIGFMCFGE
jgi:hypothetical protein